MGNSSTCYFHDRDNAHEVQAEVQRSDVFEKDAGSCMCCDRGALHQFGFDSMAVFSNKDDGQDSEDEEDEQDLCSSVLSPSKATRTPRPRAKAMDESHLRQEGGVGGGVSTTLRRATIAGGAATTCAAQLATRQVSVALTPPRVPAATAGAGAAASPSATPQHPALPHLLQEARRGSPTAKAASIAGLVSVKGALPAALSPRQQQPLAGLTTPQQSLSPNLALRQPLGYSKGPPAGLRAAPARSSIVALDKGGGAAGGQLAVPPLEGRGGATGPSASVTAGAGAAAGHQHAGSATAGWSTQFPQMPGDLAPPLLPAGGGLATLPAIAEGFETSPRVPECGADLTYVTVPMVMWDD